MLTDFNDIWHTASWRNLTLVDYKFDTSPEKTLRNILRKIKWFISSKVHFFLEESGWLWKEPVVFCGKINGSNATESVQSDHPVHEHMLPVVLFSAVFTERRWNPNN